MIFVSIFKNPITDEGNNLVRKAFSEVDHGSPRNPSQASPHPRCYGPQINDKGLLIVV